jgi:hypothetical protein
MSPLISRLALSLYFSLFFAISAIAGDNLRETKVKFTSSKSVASSALSQHENPPSFSDSKPCQSILKVEIPASSTSLNINATVLTPESSPLSVDNIDTFKSRIFSPTASPSIEKTYSKVLKRIPLHDESVEFLRHLELFFKSKPDLDDVDRIEIIQTLARLSAEKRTYIMDCADQHFTREMNGEDGPEIIASLVEIKIWRFVDRLECARSFFTPGMKYGDKIKFIRRFAELPTTEDCKNIRDHVSTFSVKENDYDQMFDLIDALKSIINTQERDFKVYITRIICDPGFNIRNATIIRQ